MKQNQTNSVTAWLRDIERRPYNKLVSITYIVPTSNVLNQNNLTLAVRVLWPMGWQQFIDDSLLGTSQVSKAAIHGLDGKRYASSADFVVSKLSSKVNKLFLLKTFFYRYRLLGTFSSYWQGVLFSTLGQIQVVFLLIIVWYWLIVFGVKFIDFNKKPTRCQAFRIILYQQQQYL